MKRIAIIGIAVTVFLALFAGQAAAASPAKVVYGVNFRAEPSAKAEVYRMLKKGENIQVLERVNSYWLKVQDSSGKVGYISSDSKYIDYIQTGSTATTAKAVKGVNFRSQPKVASNNVIGFISKGSTVQVLEQVNSYWLKVQYNGKVGYASISYFDYAPGGSSGGSTPSAPAGSTASAIVTTALAYKGAFTYKFGAEPWNTNYKYSDCSAFVQLVFNKIHGFNLPRTSIKQSKEGKYVAKANLQAGDLVFFDTNGDGTINHVGIYIGNGEFIHSSPSNKVGINNLNTGYWKNHYVTARRVL
jgi:cell wall-associated NlpC family hydrolase